MWGRNEIVSVGFGVFAFLLVVIIFVFLVIPSNRQLAAHKSEADGLETVRMTANQRYGDVTNTHTRAVELISSEEDFEQRYLPAAETGRNQLYQRLNSLISAYGLTNTSGPDYSPLETIDQNTNARSEEERGRDKFRSLFPGVYVSMTVEGPYQNLRRFIKDIETGQEFIVISTVQLVPSDNESQSQAPKPVQQPQTYDQPGRIQTVNPSTGRPAVQQVPTQPQPLSPDYRGRTKGELVSLHLEMAAYFRRPNFVMTLAQ
jgi:hypothetical protein